ncbi:MAG: hydrogenase maturation protease [Candidatus Omnitrophica bacterium]|nr:hydrogenase maturation protease [Candidatus Omnitrophota bacterium]
MKTLVLCLGNDLIADDAVGIAAARQLRDRVGDLADVEESAVSGAALLEIFLDYERAVIVDAIHTHRHPPGTILKLRPGDLGQVAAPSPHYAGLPELIVMAEQMELSFPKEIVIFAMEIEDSLTIGGEMTAPIRQALPQLVEQVVDQLKQWEADFSGV